MEIQIAAPCQMEIWQLAGFDKDFSLVQPISTTFHFWTVHYVVVMSTAISSDDDNHDNLSDLTIKSDTANAIQYWIAFAILAMFPHHSSLTAG